MYINSCYTVLYRDKQRGKKGLYLLHSFLVLEIEPRAFTMSYIPSPFHLFIFIWDRNAPSCLSGKIWTCDPSASTSQSAEITGMASKHNFLNIILICAYFSLWMQKLWLRRADWIIFLIDSAYFPRHPEGKIPCTHKSGATHSLINSGSLVNQG